ncbi:ankyrin repeat domain-containing protein [Bremerella cremea]|uniref:Ankyrin repeat domain-containing protein n=1 Tax=Bremerella cremea TaxID=1031537 RepID=A0A368KN07_9BACT|nr:ankyrin repeat domain-containing protein [Bremerella cremea]RCS44033.1 ankyrin repeat domain-containing protein [Bremerella cremea]
MINSPELEYWASLGNTDKVRELIGSGCDVNERGDNGYTALHAAVLNRQVDVVRLLLERGADIHAKLDSGQTPEDFAVIVKDPQILVLLRSH